MQNTNFDSPHGLMNIQNLSTAYDMCKLLTKCMSVPLFRKIVGAKVYTCVCKANQISKKDSSLNLFENEHSNARWFETAGSDSSDTEVVSAKE